MGGAALSISEVEIALVLASSQEHEWSLPFQLALSAPRRVPLQSSEW